ncbi:MAG: pyruvate dehydrogenase complex dihydrolipoamide acetyltransferase [Bacteroidia bacterium]|nr:pyruvate dehydrogenase complex dihydrolipoamide acetyltransferase [Bacteroidia bacterium]
MAEVIRMPKMSDTMTEGVIVAWHKKVGDTVKTGDILAEVETDKATMELENYAKGTLLHIGIETGKSVPVDAIIAIVGKAGEDISALLSAAPAAVASPAPAAEEIKETPVETVSGGVTSSGNNQEDSRIKVSPLAKKLAQDKGIDIKSVHGTGENGRIVKRDVEKLGKGANGSMPAYRTPGVTGKESFEDISLSQMRKAIARRLSESKNTAPHFYLKASINMDKAMDARKSLNEVGPVKISLNDMVVKAVAASLRLHPKVNSSWLGDKIRMNHHIHIGIAVAIDDGLIVPVVKFADNKSIFHIGSEIKELADKAKNKKLQPQEFEGNTFTISNLGMYGIDEFTAIINPPDSCILAVGAAKETVISENGQIKVAQVMKVTLSCDHRSVDGAIGSAFLQTLKDYLENPVKLLV